jgi:hypothetical protein
VKIFFEIMNGIGEIDNDESPIMKGNDADKAAGRHPFSVLSFI